MLKINTRCYLKRCQQQNRCQKFKRMFDSLNVVGDNFPYIPSQAFLYQPTSKNPDIDNQSTQSLQTDDYIIKTKDNQIKRLIFEGNTKYTKYQNTKLEEFQQYLQRKNITIDTRWNRSWRLRWLQSTNYDNKKTIQDMKQYIQYLDKNKELNLAKNVQKYMKAGVYYLAGRDSKYRPILILDVKKMIKLNLPEQEIYSCQVYFFEFIIRNMLIPGQVEMWNTIIDVGYEGVMSMMGPMKSSISFLQSTFRSRMYVAYIIRPSGTCSFLWSIAQKFLQQDTKRKVVFADGQVLTSLLQYCHPSQLQTKFGGALVMQENNCWPPKTFSSQFDSKVERKMLTEEQYLLKFENKQLSLTKVYQPFIKHPVLVTERKIYMEIEQKLEQNPQVHKQQKQPTRRVKQSRINLIEVDIQITKCLQKLKAQDITFLQTLNLQSQTLKPESNFDWLINS